jgi:hypothetical protein
MAICFDNGDLSDTYPLLTDLGVTSERIAEGQCLEDDELRAMGLNPEAMKALADQDNTLPPLLDEPRFLSPEAAQRGRVILDHLGGAQYFKEITGEESCWGQKGQLRFFLNHQVLNEPQYFAREPWEKIFVNGIQSMCPYDEGFHSVMNGAFFSVADMPPVVREAGLAATVNFISPDEDREDGFWSRATGVVISEEGFVLTDRHVISKTSSHARDERKGLQHGFSASREPIKEDLNIRNHHGDVVPITEDNVVYRFPGYDVVLLHIPELAGHPHVSIARDQPEVGTQVYIVGYPANIHRLEDHVRERYSSAILSAAEVYCDSLDPNGGPEHMECMEHYEKLFEYNAPNIAEGKVPMASVGTITLPPDYIAPGPSNYGTTAPIRPGNSGSPLFVIENGTVKVAGIVNAVSIPNDGGYTAGSIGTMMTPYSGFIFSQIAERLSP